jgi:putative peptidoglycan lipid II flippase
VVITIIATLLSAGSLAVFNLANNLQYFPIGIFGISFAIAAFPTLSALAIKENKNDFVESFSNTTRQILFFIIPASALFLILRAQIVRVILGSGAFTWEDTILTADCLAMFSVSLFAQSLTPLLIRGFYALHNAITPFLISLFCAILNIVLSLYFTGTWIFNGIGLNLGVAGLALAFSIAQILNFAILWVFLKFKVGSLDEKRIIWAVFKISIATLIMGIVTQFMKFGIEPFFGTSTFLGIFAQGLIAGLVGIAVFIIVGLVLRSAEMFTFVDAIKRRLFKNKAVVQKEGLEEL